MLTNDKLLYDKAFRHKIHRLDAEALAILAHGSGSSVGNSKVKVQTNTKDKMYLVIPKDPKSDLLNVQAAGEPASTLGSVGSLCSTFSTLSTDGCA